MNQLNQWYSKLVRNTKKLWLALARQDVRIDFFTANPPVAINDLPTLVQWRIKNCWSAEITEIGPVSSNGLRILNNKQQHKRLTLKAYGRKGTTVTLVLPLHHRGFSFQPFLNQALSVTTSIEKWLDAASQEKLVESIVRQQDGIDNELKQMNAKSVTLNNLFSAKKSYAVDYNMQEMQNRIAGLAAHQQQYFEKTYQLQNPETFTLQNLYQ